MPDTTVKLQDITPVKSTFDNDDQILLINPTGEARISKEDFLDAMPDDAITLIGDITTTGIEGDTVAKQLGALENSKAPAITETTESSAIANFTDGADDLVMHNIVAEINPVQDLSNGDPSPTNICPISGWTGCNVTRTGANLYSVDNGAYNVPVYGTDGTIGSYPDVHAVWIPVKPNTLYTVASAGTESATFYVRWINCTSDKSFISRPGGAFNSTQLPYSFSTPSNCYWVEVAVNQYQASQISKNDWEISVIATADTTYEPYQSDTLTVDWSTEAGTVYGGTIDVATGLLTVTHEYYNLKNTSASNIFSYDYNGKHGVYFRYAYGIIATRDSGVCNMAHVSTEPNYSASQYMWFGVNSNNVFWIGILDALNMTLEEFKTWIQSNDVYITRRIATPQTYLLTGQQLMTLLGTNNVWADIGNVSVTYAADTKMFIEKLTMPTEDDLVANQAITSGKYFMIGNSLYLALANIASGAQITIGTNAQRVSLADALNTINS